ncbi:Prolyl tripeptidyl peptidase precursor [compost metagenome]
MKKSLLFSAILTSFAAFGAPDVKAADPIPVAALAKEPAIQSATLSPDGSHLAALTSLDGKSVTVSIWDTSDLTKAPVRFGLGAGAERANVHFLGLNWVSNDRLLVLANQPLTTGPSDEGRGFTYLARLVDRQGEEWIEPLRRGGTRSEIEAFADKFLNVSLFDSLPEDDDHILLEYSDFRRGSTDIYKVDVRTGSGDRVARAGSDESFVPVVDADGTPRVKQYITNTGGDWTIGYRILNRSTGQWEDQPALSYPIKNRRSISIIDFDPENPNLLLVSDNHGSNLTAIKGYDVTTKAFVETLFAHPRFDATNVVFNRQNEHGVATGILGFTYAAGASEVFWTDPQWKALQDALQAQFPNQYVRITGNSRDGSLKLLQVSSSTQPPIYYLFRNNQELMKVGDSNTAIDPANLAPSELVYYQARDGLRIPAFLTLPQGYERGSARIPAIILPHGGPWARDSNDWDQSGWVQFLASRGYVVLQPQYRGSDGWGDALWKAGDREWGQKMQDDKDDGAKWLVDQGIADPNRLAMFGYSYGGFAAMAAAVRPDSPYKCAIAGAGVSDLDWAKRTWGRSRIQRQMQGDTVGGMNPLRNVSNINVPMLVYSGDRDQTVPIVQSRQWVAALQGARAPVRFFEVKDMPHSLPWWPSWQEQTLTEIGDYLARDCGGGGL